MACTILSPLFSSAKGDAGASTASASVQCQGTARITHSSEVGLGGRRSGEGMCTHNEVICFAGPGVIGSLVAIEVIGRGSAGSTCGDETFGRGIRQISQIQMRFALINWFQMAVKSKLQQPSSDILFFWHY